jgi:hypothetical protein
MYGGASADLAGASGLTANSPKMIGRQVRADLGFTPTTMNTVTANNLIAGDFLEASYYPWGLGNLFVNSPVTLHPITSENRKCIFSVTISARIESGKMVAWQVDDLHIQQVLSLIATG